MKVLLVEDNASDARLVREMLRDAPSGGFDVDTADRLASALECLGRESFDAVLVDPGLPDSDGIETVTRVQGAAGKVPAVVLTGLHDERFGEDVIRAGAQDYLVKGHFNPGLLSRSLRYAVERKRAETALRSLRDDLAETNARLADANAALQREIGERRHAEQEVQALNATLEQRVRERTDALRDSEQRVRTIFDTAPVSIWLEDWSAVVAELERLRQQGIPDIAAYLDEHEEFAAEVRRAVRVLDANQEALAMFGARDLPSLTQALQTVFSPSESLAGFQGELMALAQGGTSYHAEIRFNQAGNGARHGLLAVSLPPPGATAGHALVAVADITERRRMELELRKVAAELTAANHELEAFAYSISHDLRAPLRSIDGFSRILLRDYDAQLDEQGRDHLRRVRGATQRMGELIDDVLELSRLTRAPLRRVRVDLSALVGVLVDELRQSEPERSVDVQVQPGVFADADPVLIRAVMDNLISNAWKFTRPQANAKIAFDVEDHAGQRAYVVRDNGVGFDPAHAGKLFGAFQRLHPVSEFPGSGVGLATVRRIVHRHGGLVWAESKVNAGASFYFTLAAPPPTP